MSDTPIVSNARVIADRFELERPVASGGMGTIWRARDRGTETVVALKLLAGAHPDEGRFAREGRVLSTLSHPGIVRYVDHGKTPEGEAYLAMEWLEGEDLAARLARGPLDVGDAIALVRRAAEALGAAHAAGIIHRDVKPSNIFLEGGSIDAVKVVDFGIARASRAEHLTRYTGTGMAIGTPGYMAPEQVTGKDVRASADVFSLGCVLFECIAGRPAFEGEHVVALLTKILFEDVPRLRTAVPVDAWLDDLVARMLAKAPEQRPRDGGAVAAELAEAEARETHERPASLRIAGAEVVIASVVLAIRSSVEQMPTMAGVPSPEDPAPVMRVADREESNASLRRAIELLGGELEALPDGALVVVVRSGGAATDRAAVAARCAMVLARELPDALVAVATGRKRSQSWSDGQARPFGEAVDRAAALLRAPGASPGVVHVDDVTAGLLDARFELRPTGAGMVLGGERAIVEEMRTLLGRPTPCVGRDRELDARSDAGAAIAAADRAERLGATGPLLGEVRAARGRAHQAAARWSEARADFEAALELLPADRTEQRAELQCALAVVCHWLVDGDGVRAHAAEAMELATRAGRRDLRQDAAAVLALSQSVSEGMDAALETVRAIGEVGVRHSPFVALIANILYLSGQGEEAVTYCRRVVDAARRACDDPTLGIALQILATSLAGVGSFGEAERTIAEAIALTKANGMKSFVARAISVSAGIAFDAFDVRTADERAAAALEAARDAGFAPAEMMASIDRARFATVQGDVAAAERWLRLAEDTFAKMSGAHAVFGRVRVLVARAEVNVARCAWADAMDSAAEAIEVNVATMRPKYEAHGRIARARALCGLGRRDDAISELYRAVELADRMGDPALLLRAASPLADLVLDEDIADRARRAAVRMTESLDGPARARLEGSPMVRAALGARMPL